MRTLVTGAAGFVGRYAVEELSRHGHTVAGLDQAFPIDVSGATQTITADLCSEKALMEAVAAIQPEACLHLGALAFVPSGESAPERMFSVNVIGTMNLMDALHAHAPDCRFLAVSSAQVYGRHATEQAVTEEAPLLPDTVYAVSKSAMESAVWGRAAVSRAPAVVARPNNHTGPGQSERFVIPALLNQIRAIRDGRTKPVLHVGNLDSVRDFSDVRDVVRAYRLLLESGTTGLAYNITAAQRLTIREILDTLCALAGILPEIQVDPERFRPTDASPFISVERLHRDTGWQAEIPLAQTLRDMLESGL